jgi:hydrogenase nickel incorporation protein HypB
MKRPSNDTVAAEEIGKRIDGPHGEPVKALVVALIGPPGAGKTAVLEATARQLRGHARVGVVILNPAAERDADRVSRYCGQVAAVSTARPDAAAVRKALRQIDLSAVDILFVESVGGIAGAPDFRQDVTVTVLSVSGGDDKAAEYAQLLRASSVLLLSKADLQRHVNFDRGIFRADVRRINPSAELMEISAFENTGLARWLAWLDRRRQERDPHYHPLESPAMPPEWFVG